MSGTVYATTVAHRLPAVRGGDRVALVHGNGGVLSSQATALLGVE